MTDPLSGTFRGGPARLRPSWRLSRRQRAALVAVAPLVVFGAASWWLGEFLAALVAAGVVTTAAGVLVMLLFVWDDRDYWRDSACREVAELGRRTAQTEAWQCADRAELLDVKAALRNERLDATTAARRSGRLAVRAVPDATTEETR